MYLFALVFVPLFANYRSVLRLSYLFLLWWVYAESPSQPSLLSVWQSDLWFLEYSISSSLRRIANIYVLSSWKDKDINQRFVIGSLSVKANQAISLGLIVVVLSFSVFGMALMGTSCLPMFVGMVLVSLIGIGLSYFFTPYLYLFLRTHIHFTGAEEKIQNQRRRKLASLRRLLKLTQTKPKKQSFLVSTIIRIGNL